MLTSIFLFEYKYVYSWYGDAELDALEADMGLETESDGVPSYLQPDFDAELNLPSAPTGQSAVPAGRANTQVDKFGHSKLLNL